VGLGWRVGDESGEGRVKKGVVGVSVRLGTGGSVCVGGGLEEGE